MNSIYGSGSNCDFIKTNKVLHLLHTFHELFTFIIWATIIVLLIDYYHHILPHSSHEGILWFEFVCYSLFLAIPISFSLYRKYKCKDPEKLKTI